MGGGINHISLYINTIAINTPQNINDKYFTLTANIQIKSNKQILMKKYFWLLMMSANAL